MKTKVLTCCVAMLLGFAAFAPAADRTAVSNDTLASMGLGGMQQMSDEAGMNVRGKGFAGVFGLGIARAFNSVSTNGYVGTSSPWKQPAYAAGTNGSIAIGGGILPIVNSAGFFGTGAFGWSNAYAR